MNKLSKSIFGNISLIKKLANWLLYLLFASYILYLLITTPQLPLKLIYGLIGGSVLSVVCLFEWLKSLYEKMIVALTFDCDIEQALVLKEKLIKSDIFKGFRPSLLLFDALLLLDSGQDQNCLAHMATHHDFFHGTLDYLLIKQRTTLQCAYFLGDKDLFDDALSKLRQLKQQQTRKKQLTPLYSWEEIKGLQFYREGRFSQSKKTLAAVSTNTFNRREKTYLVFEQAQVAHALGNSSEAHRLLKEVIREGNQLHLVTLANRKEWITFEEY